MTTFYDLKADLPGGNIYDFATLKGKVVLIVNTASGWYVILYVKLERLSLYARPSQWPNPAIRGYAISLPFNVLTVFLLLLLK